MNVPDTGIALEPYAIRSLLSLPQSDFRAFMQQHVEPFSLSFIYILEPILSAIVAFFYLHEVFPPTMYAGEALVLLGVVLQTAGALLSGHLESFVQLSWLILSGDYWKKMRLSVPSRW